MIKYDRNFAKAAEDNTPVYAPIPLSISIPHHDEWDEEIIDPETGEPTGETEHKERDWVETRSILHPTAADFALAGYLPLIDDKPTDPPAGYHYARQDSIEISEDKSHYSWLYALVENPPPKPRIFSKFNLELALFKAGLLAPVDAFIDSQSITNEQGETMPLRRAYSTALTFSEDNQYFGQFLEAIKQTLGIDDATVEAILEASISDESPVAG